MDMMNRRTALRGLAGMAGTALLEGCCGKQCTIRTDYVYNNAVLTDGISPIHPLSAPASLGELVDAVRVAECSGQTVRMVGSGHSFSNVAFSDDYLLEPQRLSGPMDLDETRLKAKSSGLFRVKSGTTVRTLNDLLWDADTGFGMQNMGGYDAQTIVGATMTGTHGSGLAWGPLTEQIVSYVVVTSGGKVLQVEPKDGITDPSKHEGVQEGQPVELRQDDSLFRSLSVSMGCLGIVHSVVLQAVPRYWLRETRTLTKWEDLKKPEGMLGRLLSGKPIDDRGPQPDFYEIYFNPYPPHRCLVTKRYKIGDPGTLTPEQKKRGKVGGRMEAVMTEISGEGTAIAEYLNAHPEAAPGWIDNALDAIQDREHIGRSFEVFNLGPVNQVRVYGIECGFEMHHTIEAVEHLFDVAAWLKKRGIVHSSPPSLRFVAASQAPLAMMYGRPTMMLEMGMFVCARGADDLLSQYEKRFMRSKFLARPHWGLDLNQVRGWDQVRRLYPAADEWREHYEALNETGVFNGPFTDRLCISRPTRGRRDPAECVARGDGASRDHEMG